MPKAKYRIVERSGGGHGDLYELEEDTFFDVVEVGTGKVLMTFVGSSSATLEGGQWSNWTFGGVSKVHLKDSNDSVLVYRYGSQEPEVIKLLR